MLELSGAMEKIAPSCSPVSSKSIDIKSGMGVRTNPDSGMESPSSPRHVIPTEKGTLQSFDEHDDATSSIGFAGDSGQGSDVAEDHTIMAYHFYIPTYLCGILIGARGANVQFLRQKSRCEVKLQRLNVEHDEDVNRKPDDGNEIQLCIIQGTRSNIDTCLDIIRERFPLPRYKELTLEQKNLPVFGTQDCTSQFSFMPGEGFIAVVAAIVSGGHFFIHLPDHHSYRNMQYLMEYLQLFYNEIAAPSLPHPVNRNTVCVARAGPEEKVWYRVLVLDHDLSSNSCDVQFLDLGGFANVPYTELRQIREDFLRLPFQALECLLANVAPFPGTSDGCEWSPESANVLDSLVSEKILTCRIIAQSSYGAPIVHLAYNDGTTTKLINREMVDSGSAVWIEEHPFETSTLLTEAAAAKTD